MKILKSFYKLSPEEKKNKKKELIYGLISGILLGISFPPLPSPVFIFFAFIPYLFVIEKKTATRFNKSIYILYNFFLYINNIILGWKLDKRSRPIFNDFRYSSYGY